jgi:6-phosphogluconate dehydrogenase
MALQAFGIVGMGVMGHNLALNIERNGFPVAVYDLAWDKTEQFLAGPARGRNIRPARTPAELVALLARPRRILVMVNAGRPVDAVIDAFRPLLEGGDILIDGGNSLFTDTERRVAALADTGIKFFGMGVSGGEEGALHGPALMPGGDLDAYRHLEPIFTKIAARSDSGPCVTHCGARGAGHFVKMVHNGIEYGDMQLIAEAYDLLKNIGGLDNARLQQVFTQWNQGPDLKSYLIEITSKVINFIDKDTGKPLVELILDQAGAKGTGKWTSQTALDLGVAIPTISAAVDARNLSGLRAERQAAAGQLRGPRPAVHMGDVAAFIEDVRGALYCSKVCSYAQGYALLRAADQAFKYGLNMVEISRIWKAGCIIRAAFLDEIMKAFTEEPALANLLMARRFQEAISTRQGSWRRMVAMAVANGIPTPAFSGSLAYYDAYRRPRLPANLIQAQRDFFGAHTYERLDKPGTFHTEWNT